MSDSLWPHELQHARPPCPSPTPRVHSNSHPSNWWCHPAISSSVIPFSSCPQSLPASECFLMSQLFAWGAQSTRVSALASFFPKNTQGWSPSEWTGWISLQSRDSQESSPTPQFKSINSLALSFLHNPTLTSIHDHWKNHSLDYTLQYLPHLKIIKMFTYIFFYYFHFDFKYLLHLEFIQYKEWSRAQLPPSKG